MKAQIKDSSLQDFKDWVNENVDMMEAAYARGNTSKVFKIVNKLSRKAKPPPQNLTRDKNGKLLESAEELAATWKQFLQEKFAATEREAQRPEMEQIPSYRAPNAELTLSEFNKAVAKLPNHKAVGPDGIPAEVIKSCPAVRRCLFTIIQSIWKEEKLPDSFALARFTMIYQKKGSVDDPAMYRCIALLNHAYKILSHIILMRLTDVCELHLKD